MASKRFQEPYKSTYTNAKLELDVTILQLNYKSRLQLVLIHLHLLKLLAKNSLKLSRFTGNSSKESCKTY